LKKTSSKKEDSKGNVLFPTVVSRPKILQLFKAHAIFCQNRL